MKKATQIVLLVAGIAAIVGAIGWFIGSICYIAFGAVALAIDADPSIVSDLPESLRNFLSSYALEHDFRTWAAVGGALIGVGVVYLIFAIFCIPCAVLSFAARKKDAKPNYILCIIFGALSATGIATIGGILGLIHLAVDQPKEEQPAEESKEEKTE